jgi:cytochrome c553
MKPSEQLREKMEAFGAEGVDKVCRACGHWWDPYRSAAHHVVYRQHLPAEHEWDTRNALPLCADCHERHHNASRRIAVSCLEPQNLEFAREVLGDYADDYLARYYGDA